MYFTSLGSEANLKALIRRALVVLILHKTCFRMTWLNFIGLTMNIYEPQHDKTNKMASAQSD